MAGYFRGSLRGATGGMSQLAAALMRGPQAEQQGYDAEMGTQTRLAQALAQINHANAQTDKIDTETGVLRNRPNVVREQAALAAGVDIPTIDAFRERLAGGNPMVPMGPEAPDGSMGVGSAQFGAESSSRIGQALQRLVPLMAGTGDIKVDDWAQALGRFREQDLGDAVLNGTRTAADVGRSQAAVAAKPLYNADSTGAVLDIFGGGLDVANPMAKSTIALRGEQAGQAKAGAAENYAQAEAARANAAKTRAEAADGVNRGGAKAPTGYRWGADGSTLEAIPGGPADPNTKGAKLAKPPTEGQAKALMFGTRMQVADEVLADLEKQGARMPSLTKMAVEQTPIIGPALGMAANATVASAAQQQVEQAQRDFINAVLRRESGAVISPQEFANAAQQYFPRPGDSPAVLRQKAANRRTAIAGMRAEFGEAMQPEFERIVGEARASRAQPQQGQQAGGWKIERVPD